jgi:hypothetical protein
MIGTITAYPSKGIINDDTDVGNWVYKTNFNMPNYDIFDGLDYYTTFTYDPGVAYSFDLSGFSPGYEINHTMVIVDITNDGAEVEDVDCTVVYGYLDTYGDIIPNCYYSEDLYYPDLPAGYSIKWFSGLTIGVAPWEVSESGVYPFETGGYGTPSFDLDTVDVTMSNCPSINELSSSKMGYIWVDGEDLCFVNANQWKHTMVGDDMGDADADEGFLWIDTSNYLNWIGEDGHRYRAKWCKRQFPSAYSNSATTTENAGTSKKGFIWVDDEYGYTHLGYIGYDGYKYITGAGDDPYIY